VAGVNDGDDDRGAWDPAEGDGHGGGRPTARAKVIVAVVLSTAMLLTIVLCCVAAGRAGDLWWLPLPPP
jgi:hypothetical protein